MSYSTQETDEIAIRKIATLIKSETGITLPSEKFLMVQSRLKSRLLATGKRTLSDYYELLSTSTASKEREKAISCLTTNVSSFFREDHHLDLMAKYAQEKGKNYELLIWSAGCSYGQEPYSISMTLHEKYKFKLLATDIDLHALRNAKAGCYKIEMLSNIEEIVIKKFFTETKGVSEEEAYEVIPNIKKNITFKRLNLLSEWPIEKKFDIVFCRNVVIYFDSNARESLWPRFANSIKPNGLFFLGHSERVVDSELYGLESCGPTSYRLITNATSKAETV